MSQVTTSIRVMAKTKTQARCSGCGRTEPKWVGQCPGCAAWGTLVEETVAKGGTAAVGTSRSGAAVRAVAPAVAARPIRLVPVDTHDRARTGIAELDRVLGGGLVPGSVTLLGGEPGIGKSTILLQLLAGWSGRSLYVTAEESAQQVRLRAERLDAVRPNLWLFAETALPHIIAAIDDLKPDFVVIDSIQTVHDPAIGSAPGSVTQVRGCAQQLVSIAKLRNVPIILVGHVTKEGSLAGPRMLERQHRVDDV